MHEKLPCIHDEGARTAPPSLPPASAHPHPPCPTTHPVQKMPWLAEVAPSPGCGFRPGRAAESSRPIRPII